MENVIKILMDRDGDTREQAAMRIVSASDLILEAISNEDYQYADEILMEELGLENDYILDII